MEWYYWTLGIVALLAIAVVYFKKIEPERRRAAILQFVRQKIKATEGQQVQFDWEKLESFVTDVGLLAKKNSAYRSYKTQCLRCLILARSKLYNYSYEGLLSSTDLCP